MRDIDIDTHTNWFGLRVSRRNPQIPWNIMKFLVGFSVCRNGFAISVILNWIWKLTTGKNYVETVTWCYGLWHCRVFQVDTNVLHELDASFFRITDLKMKALCLSTISVSTPQQTIMLTLSATNTWKFITLFSYYFM